jgi:hypothetical protein
VNVLSHIAGNAAGVVVQPAAFALIRTACPVRRIFAAIRRGARRQPAVQAFGDSLRLALAGRH